MMLISIFSIVFLALLIAQHVWYEIRIEKLLNRLMAKSLAEFKYYQDAWKTDVKVSGAAKEQLLAQTAKPAEKSSPTETHIDLSQFGDDWS